MREALADLVYTCIRNDDEPQPKFLLYLRHPLSYDIAPLSAPSADECKWSMQLTDRVHKNMSVGLKPLPLVLDSLTMWNNRINRSSAVLISVKDVDYANPLYSHTIRSERSPKGSESDCVRLTAICEGSNYEPRDNTEVINIAYISKNLDDPNLNDRIMYSYLFERNASAFRLALPGLSSLSDSLGLVHDWTAARSLYGGLVEAISHAMPHTNNIYAFNSQSLDPTGFCVGGVAYWEQEWNPGLLNGLTKITEGLADCLTDCINPAMNQPSPTDVLKNLVGVVGNTEHGLNMSDRLGSVMNDTQDAWPMGTEILQRNEPEKKRNSQLARVVSQSMQSAVQEILTFNTAIAEKSASTSDLITVAECIIKHLQLLGTFDEEESIPLLYRSMNLAGDDVWHPFSECMFSFLHACMHFCDRTEEGRPLHYSFMLADPQFVTPLPGARPLPLTVETAGMHRFIKFDELHEYHYLISDSARRCVVLPPGSIIPNLKEEIPSFVIDTTPLFATISDGARARIWNRPDAIMSRLTACTPGGIGAVVGPGPGVRLYAAGLCLAVRDGREWSVRSPRSMFTRCMGSIPECSRVPMQILTELSLQLSPKINDKNSGGLLLWTPSSDAYVRKDCNAKSDQVTITSLRAAAPVRYASDDPWLNGRSTVSQNKDQEADRLDPMSIYARIDSSVAKLLLRAAGADGAVCTYGDTLTILDFAQKISPVQSQVLTELNKAGTKRAAAQDFAYSADDGRFAIAVSSDGPIRIYTQRTSPKMPIYAFCTPKTMNTELNEYWS